MDFRDIKDILACPACKYEKLHIAVGRVDCFSCGRSYPVKMVDGQNIVNAIPDYDSPFVNPMQKLWLHLLGASSPEYIQKITPQEFDQLDEQLGNGVIAGHTILDIGGHNGKARRCLNAGQRYVCIEPDISSYPERKYVGTIDPSLNKPFLFLQGVAEYLPFRAASFDSLIMYSVIEHFFDLNAAFAEAFRVLIPGGHLYLVCGLQGEVGPGNKKSAPRKFIDYSRKHGLANGIKRITDKAAFAAKRRLNPWRSVVDLTHGQIESGHLYDNLTRKDVDTLFSRSGFFVESVTKPAGHTMFVFVLKKQDRPHA